MTLADLIACSIPDARPSTLPRAPRCLEDELLPDVQPLPDEKPSAYGEHSRAFWRKRRERERLSPHREAREPCAECGVRPAEPHGRCERRCCR